MNIRSVYSFVKIAIAALIITAAVTVAGTILLLRQAAKPESERRSEIFRPEHIENPMTEKDWAEWDEDSWKNDGWADARDNMPEAPESISEDTAEPGNTDIEQ